MKKVFLTSGPGLTLHITWSVCVKITGSQETLDIHEASYTVSDQDSLKICFCMRF